MISSELLSLLACPKCHGLLVANTEAVSLDCPHDRLRFPVVDGIPVMLVEEASAY